MTCPSCKRKHTGRTVCPTCTEPLRPKTFTIVAVLYFVGAGLSILSDPSGVASWIFALFTAAIAWYLLRMRSLAIVLAMLRALLGFVGVVVGLILLNEELDQGVARTAYAVEVVLAFVFVALMFNPAAWRALRLVREPRRHLVQIIEREGGTGTSAPASKPG